MKMLPIPADQHPQARHRGARERLDLLGREEEPVPGLSLLAEVAAGVVLERDRQVASLQVLSIPSMTATLPSIARSKTSPPVARGRSTTAAASTDLDAGHRHAARHRSLEVGVAVHA